jgi:hypothetical protein
MGNARQGSAFMPRIKDPNAPTLIRACLSLDDPTLTLLEKIRHKFHLSKANASKMIVGLALEKKIKLADVTKFHQEVWSNLSFESGQRFSQLIVDWTPEENALLIMYAKHLFSSNNRSEAVRILIAHFAVQNKLAVVGQIKKFTIIPT